MGAISYNQKSTLVIVHGILTAQRYINDILQPHLLPVIDRQRQIFQYDNARPHTARATVNFLENSNVNGLLNRPISTRSSIYGTHLIDAYVNVSRRRRRYNSSLLHCRRSGELFLRKRSADLFVPVQGDAVQ